MIPGRLLKRNEFYVFATIAVFVAVIEFQSGQFFTNNNIADIARSMIVPGMLAMGLMMEIIAGGIDVSFPSIAMLSMYSSILIMRSMNYTGSAVFGFAVSAGIGLCLGIINGILVHWLKLPAFIITLGTGSICRGFTQAVLRSRNISILPPPVAALGKKYLFTVTNAESGLSSSLPVVFIFLIAVVIGTAFILRYTILGRGIYALGGDSVAAARAGFNILGTELFVYGFMGALSGFVGLTRTVLTGSCQPASFIGYEMTIIAAVVLGGTRISGGTGTVTGTLLGTLLLTMVSNSLILLGIPTYWSKFTVGVMIVIGTGMSAWQALKGKTKLTSVVAERDVNTGEGAGRCGNGS
ncbi:MAG: ABC transporter permease [Synergistaceae bacterium]|nr:ABC transporter permease [Synergistaceae bacterium]